MIRVVQRRCGTVEGRVVELPLRRCQAPDQPVELPRVLLVTEPPALGCEVVLVPPLELSARRQGRLAGSLAADEVPAHRDEALAPLRPDCSEDVCGPSAACCPLRIVPLDRKSVVP